MAIKSVINAYARRVIREKISIDDVDVTLRDQVAEEVARRRAEENEESV